MSTDDREGLHQLVNRMKRQRGCNPVMRGVTITYTIGILGFAATQFLGATNWPAVIAAVALWGLTMWALRLSYRNGWMDRNFEHLEAPDGKGSP
jgi:hypothetical protein